MWNNNAAAHATSVIEALEPRMFCSASLPKTLLSDTFDTKVSSKRWHIPSFIVDGPATYYGRTQIRTSENAPLPGVKSGAARLLLDTYNPTGFSIYGSELISNSTFSATAGKALDVKFRAKLEKGMAPGIVGGLYMYMYNPTTGMHDEVDFELLSNQLAAGTNQVLTNVYADMPLGIGTPVSVKLPTRSTLASYHTYELVLSVNSVTWKIDNKTVRTETNEVPAGTMALHTNLWAPDVDFPNAYSATLKPVGSQKADARYAMDVDSVSVTQIKDVTVRPPVAPGIAITYVTPLGQSGEVRGVVTGGHLSNYAGVAVYIDVNGGWWTKPYFDAPLSSILANGSWSADIDTGRDDIDASAVRAYLIPKGIDVPLAGGGGLPDALSTLLYASVNR